MMVEIDLGEDQDEAVELGKKNYQIGFKITRSYDFKPTGNFQSVFYLPFY